ncbi:MULTISPECIES: hypothetical protein [Leptolyngbya]|uniref:Uncharacterized protein n=1 Tax=Leptolyngbya boryana CZ1 TaxID=3060204 RepID=A0AA97ARX9_LEPBY|nr:MULTISPECIES: hypothetical protein [Leptolyngbya]MCY6493615.1 hypothetical protein [Leptolyngbya sp. GGD]WNZ46974.1 hypothetical protein Q2T42_03860 [Leptolyngbya boryana CZ1]
MNSITLQTIDHPLLPKVLELDQVCFNGLWAIAGYHREVDSLNRELIALLSGDRSIGYSVTVLYQICSLAQF